MLNGKTILVTGGGTGIGAATAASVVAKGGNAIVMARRGETVRAVADEIGQGCLAVTGDAGNGDDVARTVELAISEFGQLDGVIAAPGAMGPGAVGDLDDEAWRRLIHGNLDTCFVTAREALPALIASQGAIVFVSSVAGIQSIMKNAGYVAAKHAVTGLMRSMVQDYGGQGVRINTVCPGWVKTPMGIEGMQPLMAKHGLTIDQAYDYVSADVPMKRAALPSEIAEPCAFLVSDGASFINGAVLVIDGGGSAIAAGALRY